MPLESALEFFARASNTRGCRCSRDVDDLCDFGQRHSFDLVEDEGAPKLLGEPGEKAGEERAGPLLIDESIRAHRPGLTGRLLDVVGWLLTYVPPADGVSDAHGRTSSMRFAATRNTSWAASSRASGGTPSPLRKR